MKKINENISIETSCDETGVAIYMKKRVTLINFIPKLPCTLIMVALYPNWRHAIISAKQRLLLHAALEEANLILARDIDGVAYNEWARL